MQTWSRAVRTSRCQCLTPELFRPANPWSGVRSILLNDFQTRRQTSTSTSAPRRVIFSGIQPTGVPHLGNYLGALQPWVKFQNSRRPNDELNFSIVDLHALTVPQDPRQLSDWRRDAYVALTAVGLDPRLCQIFYQSGVPEHTELMWILSTIASTGYLSRMTHWKSKSNLSVDATLQDSIAKFSLRLGLFSYPVLQAADILLYKTTHVPVGEDQQQHIEFARTLAGSFNHIYGDVFALPEAVMSPARRIMSLTDPKKKMSKSDPNANSRILITDDKAAIHQKFKTALTDSLPGITYEPEIRPGISNLIDILKYARDDPRSGPEVAAEFQDASLRSLKSAVAQAVEENLSETRERFLYYRSNFQGLEDEQNRAQSRASLSAGRTMRQVKGVMGLL